MRFQLREKKMNGEEKGIISTNEKKRRKEGRSREGLQPRQDDKEMGRNGRENCFKWLEV